MKNFKRKNLIKTSIVFSVVFAFFLTVNIQTINATVINGKCGSLNKGSWATMDGAEHCGPLCSVENCGLYYTIPYGSGTAASPWTWHCCGTPVTETEPAGTADWCIACDSYHYWSSSGSTPNSYMKCVTGNVSACSVCPPSPGSCVAYACTGTKPANAYTYSDTGSYLTNDVTWDYASTANINAGRKCLYYFPLVGTLTASACTIPSGGSSCATTLYWGIANTKGVSSAITASGMTDVTLDTPTIGGSYSGTKSYTFTTPSSKTFYLFNNAQQLITKTVTASCTSGTNWDGSKCVPNTCQGSPSANSTVWASDDTNLSNNTTNYSHSESNTGNKCEYKCNTGFPWNGTSCAPPMTGTLTASNCTIPVGSNSCDTSLNWTTVNPVLTSAVTSLVNNLGFAKADFHVADTNSGTNVLAPVLPYPSRTFRLYNNSVELTPADGVSATASCATGSHWNGSICVGVTCTINWTEGGSTNINGGNSIKAYQSSSVIYPDECPFEMRTCNDVGTANGSLSGNFQYQNCLPKLDPACSSTHYNCTTGFPVSGSELNSPTKWTWRCVGVNSVPPQVECFQKKSPGVIEN